MYLLSSVELDSLLLLDLMHLLSLDESDFLDDESKTYDSDSVSSSTCSFLLSFEDFVGHVSSLGSGIFLPKVSDFKCDVFAFVISISIRVKPKDGQLIKIFWRSNS